MDPDVDCAGERERTRRWWALLPSSARASTTSTAVGTGSPAIDGRLGESIARLAQVARCQPGERWGVVGSPNTNLGRNRVDEEQPRGLLA
jgi:hypothetical protein